jgi:hypothetical protein
MPYYCSIADCPNTAYCKGLCSKHYKRQWRHDDPLKTKYIYKEYKLINKCRLVCAADNCNLPARWNGYCNACAARIARHGTTDKFNSRGFGRTVVRKYNDGHRKKAENALGRKLPPKAAVHHHVGTPDTLVICPNHAYHMHLHMRMRRIAISNKVVSLWL